MLRPEWRRRAQIRIVVFIMSIMSPDHIDMSDRCRAKNWIRAGAEEVRVARIT